MKLSKLVLNVPDELNGITLMDGEWVSDDRKSVCLINMVFWQNEHPFKGFTQQLSDAARRLSDLTGDAFGVSDVDALLGMWDSGDSREMISNELQEAGF